jgi:hypothetical protein
MLAQLQTAADGPTRRTTPQGGAMRQLRPLRAAPTGYLVSPEKQHVQPAQPGEVQPLQLGTNLKLDVGGKNLVHVSRKADQ